MCAKERRCVSVAPTDTEDRPYEAERSQDRALKNDTELKRHSAKKIQR